MSGSPTGFLRSHELALAAAFRARAVPSREHFDLSGCRPGKCLVGEGELPVDLVGAQLALEEPDELVGGDVGVGLKDDECLSNLTQSESKTPTTAAPTTAGCWAIARSTSAG